MMLDGYHWVETREGLGWRYWRLVRDSDTEIVREIWNSGDGVYHTNHGSGQFLDLEKAKAVCEKEFPKKEDSDTVVVGPHGITVKSGGSVVSVSSAGVKIFSRSKPEPRVITKDFSPIREPKPEPPKVTSEEPVYRTTGLIQHWWAKFWTWLRMVI